MQDEGGELDLSRRSFVSRMLLGAGATWLGMTLPQLALAHEHVQQQVATGKAHSWEYLTPEQAAEVDAIGAQIIPTDKTPGAREAHVVNFIDHVLANYEQEQRGPFADALTLVQVHTKKLFPAASSFSRMSSANQQDVLKSIEALPDFKLLRAFVAAGFFTDPQYGGNVDQAGWKLIGFDNAGMYEQPFGYYDAEVLKLSKESE